MDNFTSWDWFLFIAMVLFWIGGLATMTIAVGRFFRLNKKADEALSAQKYDLARELNDKNFANILLLFAGLGLCSLGWLIPNLVVLLR